MERQSNKMRIKLYDPQTGELISDRLVTQQTEFNMGPKDNHKGPITLEVNLVEQTDIDSFIEYIKQLKGDLPISKSDKPKATQAKKLDKMLSEKEPLLDLLKTMKAKAKFQEDLINLLREYGYRFIASDVIKDYASPEMITLKEKHLDYQFMARLVKEAKDPANDKWDFRLVFGIKFIGEKVDRVQIYLWGKWESKWALTWKTKEDINFKKVEKVYIFPDWMDYTERRKWRLENRKVIKAAEDGKEFKPSKFYLKCQPYIKGH